MARQDSKDPMATGRTRSFAKDNNLETVLAEINGAIAGAIDPPYDHPRHPVIFVVGCPRSGTTLMMQWLASLGAFSYPSNLIARFHANPYFGARIQQALYDYDKGNQIGLRDDANYQSSLGRTEGATSPSEFWYFWRRYYPFGDTQTLDSETLQRVDTRSVCRALAGLEAAFDKPIALKAMMHNWLLPHLDQLFDKALFIALTRDPFANACSLYKARETFFDDTAKWYSFRPPEYQKLKNKSPAEQVAGQVFFTQKAIEKGLDTIADNRKLSVSYETFCQDPSTTYTEIRRRLATQGYEIMEDYQGEKTFEISQQTQVLDETQSNIQKAIESYYSHA